MAYYRSAGVLTTVALLGCGPAVSSTGSDTEGGTHGTDPGTSGSTQDTVDPSTTTGTTSGDDASTSAGTTGDALAAWCWESQRVQATGVTGLWADATTALAAAGRNILIDDGTGWVEHSLDLPEPDGGFLDIGGVDFVAARSVDDAWFSAGSPGSFVVHLEAGTTSAVDLPVEIARVLALEVDDSGDLWMLIRPYEACMLGPCPDVDAQLFRRDGAQWVEFPDSGWADTVDIVGDTIWAQNLEGTVARSVAGAPWEMIPMPFNDVELLAVSDTEAWTSGFDGNLHHYDDGAWTTVQLSPWRKRGWSVDEAGVAWSVMENSSDGEHRLRRFDGNIWVDVITIESTRTLAVASGDARLGIADDGNFIDRVSNLAGTPVVTREFERESLGNMHRIVAPAERIAVGVGVGNVQRYVDDGWTRRNTEGQGFTSIWGADASALWLVDGNSQDLWRLEDDALSAWPLSVETPNLRQVWGTGDDRAFVVGAPPHPAVGIGSTLLVMQWDGQTWNDISPDIDNPGSSERFSLHGVDEDVYVVTPGSLHHYDGAGWESFVSPSFDFELVQVRAHSAQGAFVLDSDQDLRVHDGASWHLADAVWPELTGVTGWHSLAGNATAGIYALYATEDAQGVYVFDGTGWSELELPEEVRWLPTLAVSEDGLELWVDDELQIWHAKRC